jgi:hypothetical protein
MRHGTLTTETHHCPFIDWSFAVAQRLSSAVNSKLLTGRPEGHSFLIRTGSIIFINSLTKIQNFLFEQDGGWVAKADYSYDQKGDTFGP